VPAKKDAVRAKLGRRWCWAGVVAMNSRRRLQPAAPDGRAVGRSIEVENAVISPHRVIAVVVHSRSESGGKVGISIISSGLTTDSEVSRPFSEVFTVIIAPTFKRFVVVADAARRRQVRT